MKLITTVIGTLVLFGGILMLIMAFITPSKYPTATASAFQITQVYSEATFYGVIAIAAFVLAGVLVLSLGIKTSDE